MLEIDRSELASRVFSVERRKASLFKRLGSAVVAFTLAILTLGGGATPIVSTRTSIRLINSGAILKDIDDFVHDMFDALEQDLNQLTVGEFIDKWLPDINL